MPHSLKPAWQAIWEKGKLPARPLPSPPPLATHLSQTSGTSLEQSVEIPVLIGAVTDPGEGPGPPLIFRPNCGPRAEKIFLRLPPLSQRLDDCPPIPYLARVYFSPQSFLSNYSFRSGDYVAVITGTRHRPRRCRNSLYVLCYIRGMGKLCIT